MKTITTSLTKRAVLGLLCCCLSNIATAGSVDARLSTREAYVGMPVVLQLSINNATDYVQPTVPQIDGCDVRSVGAPTQSSQVTIIRGRRSESRSVTIQYLITPRHEGTFEIPPIAVNVDGRYVTTERLRFVATTSETGNVLFVEIDGAKDKVFVGQPLELTLKIWLKPFQDSEKKITLSEGNMWQMISEQTLWGSFAERMQELAENNRRIGGQEVLRDDGEGHERSYYLYEIKATIYPTRPGKIDADDVQIVVNYPTALGRSRDPFADFFEDNGFGGRSQLSQMMDDDFFSSPFRSNRLTVTSTRPIVGEARVDATEVLPVPVEGRPADYRGAVGRYNIVTQATPTAVSAGDSITLNIGIAGTGPLELVQAPPLTELPQLTADFKVADQSLAGFVQDSTKVFSTTVRPRREGITQIPAIPFSFFDPDAGKFETAMSAPIAITVDKSESLSLDAIVGRQRDTESDSETTAITTYEREPDFTNINTTEALIAQTPGTSGEWWWFFVFAPPVVWLITLLVRNRSRIGNHLPDFRSPRQRCFSAIDRATQPSEIVTAMMRYIAARTGQPCEKMSPAVGSLRTAGLANIANDVELFLQNCEHSDFNGSSPLSLSESQQTARQLVDRIQSDFASISKSHVRRLTRSGKQRSDVVRRAGNVVQKVSALLIAAFVASAATSAVADERLSPARTSAVETASARVTLTVDQQRTILTEAGELYSRAAAIAKNRCGGWQGTVRHVCREIPIAGQFRRSERIAVQESRQCLPAKQPAWSRHCELRASDAIHTERRTVGRESGICQLAGEGCNATLQNGIRGR